MEIKLKILFEYCNFDWLSTVCDCSCAFDMDLSKLLQFLDSGAIRVAHIPGTRFPGNGSREQRFPGNPRNSREVAIIEINLRISYEDTKKIYDYTVCSKTALYASDLYLNYTLKVNFTKWIQWILYFIKAIFNIILEDSIIN